MLGDYARAAAGLVPTAAVLAIVPVGPDRGVVLGGFAALFGVFGIRTALRHGTRDRDVTKTAVDALRGCCLPRSRGASSTV